MPINAFICGCAGHELSPKERAFLADAQPWGLILFKRNIGTPDQVKSLVQSFRAAVGRADAPVLIDQEGGRVQRMGRPHWPVYPPAAALGAVSDDGSAARLAARLIAEDLADLGITIDCLPVLDVRCPGTHNVIGDRAYSDDPHRVAACGRAAAEALMAGGVLPVIKHIPGHGRAMVDSHLELPVVEADRSTLAETDFKPFHALRDMPIAMTGHVVFRQIDPEAPATTSAVVIGDVIRGEIGFDGLLLTDDLSMQALSGSLRARAEAAFRAGVDIALHCNGDLAEAAEVASASPRLEGYAQSRAKAALARIGQAPQPFDPVDARTALETALAAGA